MRALAAVALFAAASTAALASAARRAATCPEPGGSALELLMAMRLKHLAQGLTWALVQHGYCRRHSCALRRCRYMQIRTRTATCEGSVPRASSTRRDHLNAA